jgi:hypothetical protein
MAGYVQMVCVIFPLLKQRFKNIIALEIIIITQETIIIQWHHYKKQNSMINACSHAAWEGQRMHGQRCK